MTFLPECISITGMKKFLTKTISLLFAGLGLAAVPAWAESPRFALVIGNAAYDGPAALANAANDAGDVAAALESVGWQVTKVVNGDRKTMTRSIAKFRDQLSAADKPTALLYYAGHGLQINGQNYLVPIGETFETVDDVTSDAVSLQLVLDAFSEARVATDIIILDACRDNPFARKGTRSLGGSRGLSVINRPANQEGSAILFATAPGDTAADGTGRNGIFTTALLKYLKSDLSLQVLVTKVTGEVKRLTGGKQSPYSSLSLSDEFYLVPADRRAAFGSKVISPSAPVDAAAAQKAELVLKRDALVAQRRQITDQNGWSGWAGISGWSLLAVGGGLSGYAFWSAGQSYTSYQAATTQSGWDAARAQAQQSNLLFTVGVSAVGTGGLLALAAALFGPDTSALDGRISDIEHSLSLLGAK